MFKRLLATSLAFSLFSLSAQTTGESYTALVEPNYPPFDFSDENGIPIGFDVDILKAIAEKQGFTIEFIARPPNEIISGLESGSHHIGAAGFGEDEEGNNLVSDPYAYAHDVVMTQTNSQKITHFADLSHLTVTTQDDTSYAEDLLTLFADDKSKLNLQKTSFLAFREFARGKAEALLGSRETSEYYAAQFPNLTFSIHELEGARYKKYKLYFIISPQHAPLRDKINAGLQQLIDDGSYQKIYQQWFKREAEIPR